MFPKLGRAGVSYGFHTRPLANVAIIVCGSLEGDDHRPAKGQDKCQCDEGWTGINCNVCEADKACDSLVPGGEGGVCYKEGVAVKRNFQQCDVTSTFLWDMKDMRGRES